jgi:hypothetical protein
MLLLKRRAANFHKKLILLKADSIQTDRLVKSKNGDTFNGYASNRISIDTYAENPGKFIF